MIGTAVLWHAIKGTYKASEKSDEEFSQNHVPSIRHYYTRRICGYKWDWADGEPLPKVTVRPELIQQGSALLEEEEDRARRRAQGLE